MAGTVLDYSYTISSFKFDGQLLVSPQRRSHLPTSSPTTTRWDVVTCLNGRLIEDATADYFKLLRLGQSPLPLVIDLMDDPAYLSSTPWRTVLRMPKHDLPSHRGPSEGRNAGERLFPFLWHFYADNPTKPQITSGPQIESWCTGGAGG